MEPTKPNENGWPESDSLDVVDVVLDIDDREPNLPPQPIPPQHLACLLEVKRLLEEREQRRKEAAEKPKP